MNKQWDVFISHASEDKAAFVRGLAAALTALGVSVWYDEFTLRPGESLSRSIDRGLSGSTYGVVIVSHAFMAKRWPEYELRGLVSRELSEDRVIIPIWYGVSRDDVMAFSPTLADKLAVDARGAGIEDIAIRILKVVRPELYERHPRRELEQLASGEAAQQLRHELDRAKADLDSTKDGLSQFQCPTCRSRSAGAAAAKSLSTARA